MPPHRLSICQFVFLSDKNSWIGKAEIEPSLRSQTGLGFCLERPRFGLEGTSLGIEQAS